MKSFTKILCTMLISITFSVTAYADAEKELERAQLRQSLVQTQTQDRMNERITQTMKNDQSDYIDRETLKKRQQFAESEAKRKGKDILDLRNDAAEAKKNRNLIPNHRASKGAKALASSFGKVAADSKSTKKKK